MLVFFPHRWAGENAYNARRMRSTFAITKIASAIAVSLWMAAFACVNGCALLVFAPAETKAQVSSGEQNSAGQSHAHRMGVTQASCHHSAGGTSTPAGKENPAPHSRVSCCPLEVTLTPKPQPTALRSASLLAVIPAALHHSVPAPAAGLPIRSQIYGHDGRDTLLQKSVLRI